MDTNRPAVPGWVIDGIETLEGYQTTILDCTRDLTGGFTVLVGASPVQSSGQATIERHYIKRQPGGAIASRTLFSCLVGGAGVTFTPAW